MQKEGKMTEQEAIEMLNAIRMVLDNDVSWLEEFDGMIDCTFDMAVSAIKKQIPVKPIRIDKNETFDGNWKKICPNCGRILVERITTSDSSYPRIYNMTAHCICGQAIDWGSTDE